MNFRDLLLLQGVSERDIVDAVREARQATRMVKSASGLLVEVFTRAASKSKPGKKQLGLAVLAQVASKVEAGAGELLKTRAPSAPKDNVRALRTERISVKVIK